MKRTDLGEIHMTDDNSFFRQTLTRNLRITPGKEELGKILGKDLWVKVQSKETPLNGLKDRLRRLN